MQNSLLSLTESQWKLRQQNDRISHWRKNQCRTNTQVRRNESKKKDCENHS